MYWNCDEMKKVLIIATDFPPSSGVRGQRVVRFCRYLEECGWRPFVLTVEPDAHDDLDQTSLQDVPADLSVTRFRCFNPSARIEARIRKCGDRVPLYWKVLCILFNTLIRQRLVPDSYIWGRKNGVSAALCLCREQQIDLIFSTMPPLTNHVIARDVKAKTGLPWVADYRDYWVDDLFFPMETTRAAKCGKLYKALLASADFVTCISPPLADFIRERDPRSRLADRFVPVSNGFDPAQWEEDEPSSKGKITIVHAGGVYNGRNPIVLLRQFLVFRESRPEDAKLFEFLFYGPMASLQRSELETLIDGSGLNDTVKIFDSVTKDECREIERRASLLLVIVNDHTNSAETKGILTDKLFEYIESQRPVLAYASAGVARELVEEADIGFVADPDDPQSIPGVFGQIAAAHRAGQLTWNPNCGALNKYNVRVLTQQLAGVFQQACGEVELGSVEAAELPVDATPSGVEGAVGAARSDAGMKTLLMVTGVFGFCRYFQSGQKRTEGFSRYLPECDWNTIVLVPECRCCSGDEQDTSCVVLPVGGTLRPAGMATLQAALEASGCAVVSVQCRANWYYRQWMAFARKVGCQYSTSEEEAEILHFVFPFLSLGRNPSRGSVWRRLLILLAKAAARGIHTHEMDRVEWRARGTSVGRQIVEHLGVDAVVGCFPGVQNIEVASDVAKSCDLPFAADFRDSVNGGWCSDPLRTRSRAIRALRDASAVIHVTPQECERDNSLHSAPAFVIENGYLEEEAEMQRHAYQSASACSGPMTLAFVGTLYPIRNLDMVLDGLELLRQREPKMFGEMKFMYRGVNWREVQDSVGSRGLEAICDIQGSVSTAEALRITHQSAVLILPTNSAGLSGMPGAKLYEYLAARRPILAVGGNDVYVADVLARTRAGVLCDTPLAVAQRLAEWVGQWRIGGVVSLDFDDIAIQTFSRRRGAGQLAQILDQSMAATGDSEPVHRGRAPDFCPDEPVYTGIWEKWWPPRPDEVRAKARLSHFYETNAAYHEMTNGESKETHPQVRLLECLLEKGGTYAEIGCGSGKVTAVVGQHARVMGFDVSSIAISRARAEHGGGNATFEVADATRLPLGDSSVDGVYSFEVLEHLWDPIAAVREMARITRPGGFLLLSTPNRFSLDLHLKKHIHVRAQEIVLGLCRAGYDCLRKTPYVNVKPDIPREDIYPDCDMVTSLVPVNVSSVLKKLGYAVEFVDMYYMITQREGAGACLSLQKKAHHPLWRWFGDHFVILARRL
jgi:glycosyltransferase involved in cell wall biosynthesis/SAM-dependent methyltransferase